MTNLSLWVLVLPLLGFIILGLAGRFMPRTAILTVAWGACGLAFLVSVINFFIMLRSTQHTSDQIVYHWASAGSFSLDFGTLLDPLSMTMLLVVTGVGLLIHIYSAGYMADDPSFWRFFAYLNFFIFAMVTLVIADNFLFLLVGWGLVGLASYLLIGFWYQRRSAIAAAQKAFVINVIGDFGLMLAIFLIFLGAGRLDYAGVLGHTFSGTSTAIALLLFVACAAKSAQLPLYMWLPDAMEGPTPVSALIHAATMVTAGVYLVARAYPIFDQSHLALGVVAGIGGATALYAATIALFQLDIKRVLAYSTISQLGYMFMAEGVQNYAGGIFHLITHAFFKALLFLGAGAVIHALAGEQDMRKMGGLWGRLRVTGLTFLIAALAISGIFPLAGFWSKDDILASVLAEATSSGIVWYYVLWIVGVGTAGLTAFYMFRLFFGIFAGDYRGAAVAAVSEDDVEEEEAAASGHHHGGVVRYNSIHDVQPVMSIPLIILAVLSVIGGFIGSMALFGAPGWSPLVHFLPSGLSAHAPDPTLTLGWISTGVSLLVAVLGIAAAWRLYGKGFAFKEHTNPLYQLVFHKYYVDEALNAVLIKPVLALGRGLSHYVEGDVLDGGSRGVSRVFRGTSAVVRRVQTGYMRNYALGILLGVVVIIVYYAVRGSSYVLSFCGHLLSPSGRTGAALFST
ncbi:NADH-quinone oxidoreductase subunit L [Dictyobacter kobayashii]|uniref:NADH-quinone oxidoreductase subunit L n=1 Tax=Dictyobacter kobayashii TaxID=2014872 RepID=A0A402AID9_9CHLR|nr:NADH-quinone oxidoreductase subunit L [Dictyobacter kobayashii]GCE18814.1 NADH-quinone oxidoreductase subunit L [Dictyobacter kobayashii]